MTKLFTYLKPYAWGIIAAVLLLFAQAMCDLNLPNFMSRIVNICIGQPGAGDAAPGAIARIGFIMALVALAGGLASVGVGLLSSLTGNGVSRDIRRDMFEKSGSFHGAEFDKFSAASLITRCTNDVSQLQMIVMMGIRMAFFAPIMGIGGIIMAVRKSVSMSWIIALAVVVLIGFVMLIMSLAVPKFKAIQKLIDKMNLVARENLSGLMVIRAFNAQKREEGRFNAVNRELAMTNQYVNRVMVLMWPMMNLIMNGVTLLVVWVGAGGIASFDFLVGDMMAYVQYAMQVIMAFLTLSMMFIMAPRAAVSATRVAEVLATEAAIRDPGDPASFDETKKGVVEFRDVCFRYDGAEVDALSQVTFTAKQGETTALIGPTGSGKSTIANMILRFYDATSGQVMVGGVDVRSVALEGLRKKLGYVPQKASLLSGTIASNIKYGDRGAPDHEVESAAAVAQAMDFIQDKPEGFDSPISQGAANVSGGQKQRLSIARALVKKPDILIFDDSFSALDFKTDAALRKALKEEADGITQIIIAQRVGTIMNADQIIVLDKGRIVGCGKHDELIAGCTEYREIASSQLGAMAGTAAGAAAGMAAGAVAGGAVERAAGTVAGGAAGAAADVVAGTATDAAVERGAGE